MNEQQATIVSMRTGSLDDGRQWAKLTLFTDEVINKPNFSGSQAADYSVDMDEAPSIINLLKGNLPAQFTVETGIRVKNGTPTLSVIGVK